MKAYKLETDHYVCGYFKTKEALARLDDNYIYVEEIEIIED